jgi:hypothetical protein
MYQKQDKSKSTKKDSLFLVRRKTILEKQKKQKNKGNSQVPKHPVGEKANQKINIITLSHSNKNKTSNT